MTTLLDAARAAALFCSDLSCECCPTTAEATEAIRAAVLAHHGTRGCAADMAFAYGDHPDLAVVRAAWAVRTVAAVYHPGSVAA